MEGRTTISHLSFLLSPPQLSALTQLTCTIMCLRTRYVFLASLCLIMKLGCIALLLELQAATTSSSRHCTASFSSSSPLSPYFLQKPHTHAVILDACMPKSLRRFRLSTYMGNRISPPNPDEYRAHEALPTLRPQRRRRMGSARPPQRDHPPGPTPTTLQYLTIPPIALPRYNQA